MYVYCIRACVMMLAVFVFCLPAFLLYKCCLGLKFLVLYFSFFCGSLAVAVRYYNRQNSGITNFYGRSFDVQWVRSSVVGV